MKMIPLSLAATMALLITPALAAAADYPQRPISLIVPFAAGGPTDVVARSLANEMGKVLKQTVVVENRTGAGGTLAAGYVAAAKPDGHTIFLHHTGMATAPAMYSTLRYDPLKSFEYIGEVVDVPMTLMARADLPPNNFKEFVDYANANGDKINLANAGPGAVSQLCGSLLQQAMGVKFTTVPFQGTGPAMTALMGKQVDVLCDQTTQTLPHIKAKDLKFYGVTTPERIKQLPDAPTLAEQGLKGFDVKVWHGLYAPKGTPKQAVDKLNESLKVALKAPAFVQRMEQLGAQIVSEERQTPESLHKWLAAEVAKWGPILKAENISIN